MRDQIVIRMPSGGSSNVVQWIKLSDAIQIPTIKQGEIKDVVEEAVGAKIILLAPSDQVLLTTVSIPTSNKQKLHKAIPFALEEELASDVDRLHFAVGASEAGRTSVAVIEKQTMKLWQEKINESGLNVDAIVPEVLALPLPENCWSLLVEETGALLRTGEASGYGMDSENLEFMLPLAINKLEDKPETLHVYSAPSERDYSSLIDDVEVVSHKGEQGLLWVLANDKVDLTKAINLLQGDYSRHEQLGKLWRPWRFAASLAGVWFLLQLVVVVTQSSQLEAQSALLKAEAKQIYKETFPNSKRVVKPRAQMKQKLAELRGGDKVSSKATFLSLLSSSGTAFSQTTGLVLRSVRYKNGVLDVEIDVPNLQALDKLKQQLVKNEGMSVEIQSAASRNNKVQGRLQIKGQAS